jgi:isopentenyl-diphosphate delta-isomerase
MSIGSGAEHSQRKAEHIAAALQLGDGHDGPAGWADVHLPHHAVPDTDANDIDTSVSLLGQTMAMPVVIAGMTGGVPEAYQLNRALATAAEAAGVAIGVGSQRAALRNPSLQRTYRVVRDAAPTTLVLANIGASQLLDQPGEDALSLRELQAVVDMVDADALAVHLNFVEELVQPEGQRRAAGLFQALERLCAWSPVPVVAKETGSGLSEQTAALLRQAGVQALDVGGRGGTSFRAVEQDRAMSQQSAGHIAMGQALTGWGIPTPVSVVASRGGVPVIATGGIRNGVDAAKALALGATAVGVGRPVLQRAQEGSDAVLDWLLALADQLRAACFLTGCHSVSDLPKRQLVITGPTRDWLQQLGLQP